MLLNLTTSANDLNMCTIKRNVLKERKLVKPNKYVANVGLALNHHGSKLKDHLQINYLT